MALLRVVAAQKGRQVVPEAPCIPTMLAHAQARGRVTAPNRGARAEMEGALVLRLGHAILPVGFWVLVAEAPEFVIMAAQKTALILIPLRFLPVVLVAPLAGALGEALGAVRRPVLLLGRGAERQMSTEQAVVAAPVQPLDFTALEEVVVAVGMSETRALQVMPDPLQIQALQTVRP